MLAFLSGDQSLLRSNKTSDNIIYGVFCFGPDLFGRNTGDGVRNYGQPQRGHPS
jgi:hypothetical protein